MPIPPARLLITSSVVAQPTSRYRQIAHTHSRSAAASHNGGTRHTETHCSRSAARAPCAQARYTIYRCCSRLETLLLKNSSFVEPFVASHLRDSRPKTKHQKQNIKNRTPKTKKPGTLARFRVWKIVGLSLTVSSVQEPPGILMRIAAISVFARKPDHARRWRAPQRERMQRSRDVGVGDRVGVLHASAGVHR